jgi:hypothetical protein
MYPGLDQND